MKNVLVTGGGGFLGMAIVRMLVKQQIRVTSFSRDPHPRLSQMGVQQIQGDLADKIRVQKALSGVDTVFHVAAKAGLWGSYESYYKTNVQGTVNIIEACRFNHVRHLVYTSSPSVVFGETDQENVDESAPYPKTYLAPYPETKALAEQAVIRACGQGLSAVILRPHLIWGPEDNHVVPKIINRARRLKKVGRTDDLVDTIYVDNAAHAHILAAKALAANPYLSGNVYFISQDQPVSKWWMANAFLKAAGRPPIKGRVSARTAYAAGMVFETIYRLFGIKTDPPMTRFAAKELAASHWFDISKAKRDLGYTPEISIEEGLKRLEHWLSEKE